MILEGACEVGSGWHALNRYTGKAKKPPQAIVHTTGIKLPVGNAPQPDGIVFTKVNTSWVHNPMKTPWLLLQRLSIASSIDC